MTALLVATIQVSTILAVALGTVWLLRKSTAALRHALLVIALTCAAIVPALGAFMPSWPHAVLPAFLHAAPVITEASRPQQGAPPRTTIQPLTDLQLPAATRIGEPASTPAQPRWQDSLPSLLDTAYVIYLCGVAVSLATLAFGLLRLCWISARAQTLHDGRWNRRVTAIATAFGMRRRVFLARSSQPVLATWGLVRPQVLLPPGSELWPEDRIRAVLLHELAHVHRNDWAVQVLAAILRAIYWFNPLVWLAFARLRQESEQACDDVAIQQGEDQIAYAEQLLTLARLLSGNANPRISAAPSMALHSTLRRRIAVVMDPATPHSPATRTAVGMACAVLLALTCAVAACDGTRATKPATSNAPVQAQAPAAEPVDTTTRIPTDTESSSEMHADPQPVANDISPQAPEPLENTQAPDSRSKTQPDSPRMIVADILALMQTTLADESLAPLDEIARPITGLHHVQRFAQSIVDDDSGNPAIPAANYAEIINALINTANFASNITSTPRGAQLPKQGVDQLAAKMRVQAAVLAEATMPTPKITSFSVATPPRRVAISALDLAQTTLRDTEFVGPASISWMVTELRTMERAAQSVLSDSGADEERFITRLHVLRGALRSATRSATDVTQRPRTPADSKSKATTLLASIRRTMNQLDVAMLPVEHHSVSYGLTPEDPP